MYLILRHKEDNEKVEVCFVQAESATKAKDIVGVPDSSSEWGVIDTDLLKSLSNAKEGYIVISL